MAEATLVAPEETQVPQPEDTPPSPPAPDVEIPQADTPDAEPSLDAVHDEFLKTLDADESSDAGNESAPKLSPEAQAEVDRVLNEQQQQTQKQLRETGILNTFRDNANTLRTWANGRLAPQDTEALVAFFRDYHGISGQIHKSEASETAAVETVTQFYDAMAKELPATKRQAFLNARGTEHKSQADTVKAWLAAKTEGMVTKAELTKAKADAVNAYKEHLIKNRLLKGHDAPPQEGAAAAVSPGSDEAKLADPNTPPAELLAIRMRQRAAGG